MKALRRVPVVLAVLVLPAACLPTQTSPTPTASVTTSPNPTAPAVSWRDVPGLEPGSHVPWRDVSLTVVGDEQIGLLLEASGWRIDAGVVVRDATFMTRPVATDADGLRVASSFEEGERGPVLRLAVDARRPVSVSFVVGDQLVEDSVWESQTRILITPTPLGRALAASDPVAAAEFAPTMLAQVGDDPRLGGDSVLNQLACHMVGARDKPTWNLETQRPDKGLIGFMAARCN